MEPRFFNHGDPEQICLYAQALVDTFQWSHGFSTMETPHVFRGDLAGR